MANKSTQEFQNLQKSLEFDVSIFFYNSNRKNYIAQQDSVFQEEKRNQEQANQAGILLKSKLNTTKYFHNQTFGYVPSQSILMSHLFQRFIIFTHFTSTFLHIQMKNLQTGVDPSEVNFDIISLRLVHIFQPGITQTLQKSLVFFLLLLNKNSEHRSSFSITYKRSLKDVFKMSYDHLFYLIEGHEYFNFSLF